jgi:hypothetical protein
MKNATSYMIGGSHYSAMANQWDTGAFSTIKYLARHERKNGLEDVQKAGHFVELRQQFIMHVAPPIHVISMQRFIDENQIKGDTGWALMHLNRWVYDGHDYDRDQLRNMIVAIAKKYEAASCVN